ncbi:hypothetical protein BGZ73_000686 [Actinomortierella ambigua]|nr:hypothetical protein BGZ73_000686 [Actinomortierella ambigua]
MTTMREEDLLTSFLIDNEFRDTVSFAQFIRLFPSKYHSHPDLKDLYRAYLASRTRLRDLVRDNIAQHGRRQQEEAEQEAQLQQQQLEQRHRRRSARLRAQESINAADTQHGSVTPGSSIIATTAGITPAGAVDDTSMAMSRDGGDDSDYDIEIEGMETHLTLPHAIEELLLAQDTFESEIARMERECQQFAEDIQSVDKKLEAVNVPSVPFKIHQEDELLDQLEELIRLCNAITRSHS